MDFFDDSLERLKAIVRVALKYNKPTGLYPTISDLYKIQRSFFDRGLDFEATEIGFIINFLEKEKESALDLHKKKLDKIKKLSEEIPIGMILSFRYEGKTLTGELKGFLADRALIFVKERDLERLFEVGPFEIKL